MNLTGSQIRAARGLKDISREELANLAGISPETVKRIERADGPASANVQTIDAIRKAFDGLGVLFIDENGEGPGVRLRKERA